MAVSFAILLSAIAAELLIRRLDPGRISIQTSWHFLLHEAHRVSDDPDLVWEHVPGYRRKLPAYEVRIDERGLRVPEPRDSRKPEAATTREAPALVLCLGDSYTFGSGVEGTETWPARLAESLAARSIPAETVNAGVNGYSTLQSLAWLRGRGPALEPSAVVLYWVENDLTLTGPATGLSSERQMELLLREDPRSLRRRAIHLGYRVAPGLLGLARFAAMRARYRSYDPEAEWVPPPAGDPGREANLEALGRMRDLCEERAIPFLVVGLVENPFLREFLREKGIEYATVLPAEREAESLRYHLTAWDPHLTPEGYALVAETAADRLAAGLRGDSNEAASRKNGK